MPDIGQGALRKILPSAVSKHLCVFARTIIREAVGRPSRVLLFLFQNPLLVLHSTSPDYVQGLHLAMLLVHWVGIRPVSVFHLSRLQTGLRSMGQI